jgi:hypothetical protein
MRGAGVETAGLTLIWSLYGTPYIVTGTTASRNIAGELADFTATPRLLIAGLGIGIGAVGAYVAAALLALIGFFTNLFFFQRLSTALVTPEAFRPVARHDADHQCASQRDENHPWLVRWKNWAISEPTAPPVMMIGPSAPNGPPDPMEIAEASGLSRATCGSTRLPLMRMASIASGMQSRQARISPEPRICRRPVGDSLRPGSHAHQRCGAVG